MFQHLGWMSAAAATPVVMLASGAAFFGLSLTANQVGPGAGPAIGQSSEACGAAGLSPGRGAQPCAARRRTHPAHAHPALAHPRLQGLSLGGLSPAAMAAAGAVAGAVTQVRAWGPPLAGRCADGQMALPICGHCARSAAAAPGCPHAPPRQVFARSSKFSLFDPAKEMVYIEVG